MWQSPFARDAVAPSGKFIELNIEDRDDAHLRAGDEYLLQFVVRRTNVPPRHA